MNCTSVCIEAALAKIRDVMLFSKGPSSYKIPTKNYKRQYHLWSVDRIFFGALFLGAMLRPILAKTKSGRAMRAGLFAIASLLHARKNETSKLEREARCCLLSYVHFALLYNWRNAAAMEGNDRAQGRHSSLYIRGRHREVNIVGLKNLGCIASLCVTSPAFFFGISGLLRNRQ